jgi:NAD(P)-dependent dehydrogenase (short-subunit alcohol dehydrogenase family)
MLENKVVLITGATGIAAAAARAAAARGARVFIASISEEDCEQLASDIGATFRAADLSLEQDAESVVAACTERYRGIDAVFNVAGISGRRFGDGPVHECTAEGWDATFANNARSTFLVSRAAVRHMLSRGGGAILNMASVLAFSPEPRHFATHAYAASKGAIIALTAAMAAYYAPMKIRVNAVAPGLVATPMSRRAQEDPDVVSFLVHKQPLREGPLTPADVVETALFLLSDAASAVTGQVITVDGGWTVSG